MPTIGEQLRAAREAKGLALADANRHTKIHTKILAAMEEDRTDDVLEPAYARGFLKKYATFLNLDPEPLMQEYLRSPAMSTTTSSDGRFAAQSDVSRTAAQPPSGGAPSWLGPAAIAVAAVVGLAFLGFLTRDLYHTVAPSTPASKPAVKPASKAKSASKPAAKAVAEAPAAPAPALLVPKSQALKLSVRAAQDCWMQVKADDTVLFQNVLKKGTEETWTANQDIELWVGNAAALSLTLNGHALEPLGGGVQKGVRITRSGLQRAKASR